MYWYAPSQIKYARSHTSESNGTASVVLPQADLVLNIQPRSPGEFANSVTMAGNVATIIFRKFKSSGLGITLGTLLSVQAFEDVAGSVNFDLTGLAPM